MGNNFPKWIEASLHTLKSLTDGEKEDIHVGEAMACWTYLAFVESIIVYEEISLNMTKNKEVVDFVNEALKVANSHKKELRSFMIDEGVTLPAAPEHKPKSEPEAVPEGARMTENEIMNTLSINFVYASNLCSGAASQSIRTDVGLMFLKFHIDKLSLGMKSKSLMKKRGWLKIPPFYHPPGAPSKNRT